MTIEERNALHVNYIRISKLIEQFEHEAYQARDMNQFESAVEKHGQALIFQKELSHKLQES